MDVLRAAAPLARVLLSLAHQRCSGTLQLRGGRRHVRVDFVAGAVAALQGIDGEPLGDALMRTGEFDAGRHGAALCDAVPTGRVGDWLVEVGAASREAVDRALARQLECRLGALLRLSPETLRFERSGVSLAAPSLRVAVAPSVFEGGRALAAELTERERAALAGQGRLRWTLAGENFVALFSESGRASAMDRALDPRVGQETERAVLCAFGLAVDTQVCADAFGLLLRKQREVRRRVSAEALLDLPARPAPGQARSALRQLVGKLHPDRFSAESAALRSVSSEVMRALFRAEEALRGSPQSRDALP